MHVLSYCDERWIKTGTLKTKSGPMHFLFNTSNVILSVYFCHLWASVDCPAPENTPSLFSLGRPRALLCGHTIQTGHSSIWGRTLDRCPLLVFWKGTYACCDPRPSLPLKCYLL